MAIREATQSDADRFYPILAQTLREQKLPCENGPARFASADEFMIMHRNESGREIGFKHADTRNYLYLRLRFDRHSGTEVWVMEWPVGAEPFHRGWFDLI